MSKINKSYWKLKLERNVQKQKANIRELEKAGWKVFIIWECQTKDPDCLLKRVEEILL